ncbi:MAG: hypothetical protein MK212_19235 [Saprospiraceae bacterium]|nr:hypothetical protein [Saprospiraceae bacterium]
MKTTTNSMQDVSLFLYQLMQNQLQIEHPLKVFLDLEPDTHAKSLFLSNYLVKGTTWQDLESLRETLLASTDFLDLGGATVDWISVRSTFDGFSPSISFAALLIVAATGHKVAKFGDFAYSKGGIVGYSDLLSYCGCQFKRDATKLVEGLEQNNFCYIHAPYFYPVLQEFEEARKLFALPSFLDTLLPLIHPNPKTQLFLGVPNIHLVRTYEYFLKKNAYTASFVYDEEGFAEISLRKSFRHITYTNDYTFNPTQLKLPKLEGASVLNSEENTAAEVRRLERILTEAGSDDENWVVLANAAFILQHIDSKMNFSGALAEAEAALFSGRALQVLEQVIGL